MHVASAMVRRVSVIRVIGVWRGFVLCTRVCGRRTFSIRLRFPSIC